MKKAYMQTVPNEKENMKKITNMSKILNQKKKKITKRCIKNKKCLNKVGKFCHQKGKTPISFKQCVIGGFTIAVSDYLNMKNTFLLQYCIVQ